MARLANVTKAVSNTYKYVSKQPVGAAVFLIASTLPGEWLSHRWVSA
jgi:hypothetical protein